MTTDFSTYIVDRDDYLNRLDNMTFGQNPRHGYFQGSNFYHPDLRFQISFPEGWQTANQVAAVIAGAPDENAIVQVTFAQASSANEAASQFFGQQGLSASNTSSGSINNLQASWGDFRVNTESGELAGVAYFYNHGDNVYQVLAFGTLAGWSNHEPAGRAAARSLSPLTDSNRLDVEPWRLDIITTDRTTSLQQLKDQYNSPASTQQLALINRIGEGANISSGQKIKMIVGQPLP
jgi:predicted Zn-dependent protease